MEMCIWMWVCVCVYAFALLDWCFVDDNFSLRSVKTELMDDGANSTLFIAKINKSDSGNYTCSISEYQNYTIVVHILNGKLFIFHFILLFSLVLLHLQKYKTL